MKSARVIIFFLIFCLGLSAIAQQAPVNAPTQAPPPTDLNTILLQIQQATSSANADIGKLRIEKWKTDNQQKQQMQQVADSLQKNISNAVPGLISDVQTSRGGVLASFKLYHNLNVVYEFLSSMAEDAGAFGKKEEYQPLEGDATALDTVRQNLSSYIEQAAGKMEAANRAASNALQARQGPGTLVPGKKVVVIDENTPPRKRPKSTKKKTSTPPAQTSASPAQPSSSPH
ncbi:MAG TPA: hypothetical protein VHV32_14120 [Candidatus Angelobacter sp.]|jgi:hypothetical protein|nr:hypothetical protein [Candidatus Angelobacter sp.]